MKIETLELANELMSTINNLKGQIFVIDHLLREDYNLTPPSYNVVMNGSGQFAWYYVPKGTWIDFLIAERSRISTELAKKESELLQL